MNLKKIKQLPSVNSLLTLRVNTSLKIYLCGPTLYRKVHIGNLRGIYLADILARIS